MDPITLALLTGAGGEALGQVSNILPSEFERKRKERLGGLQRKEEMGLLGLTEVEKNQLYGQAGARSLQAQQRGDAQRAQLMATQGVTGGQALAAAQALEEQRAVAEADTALKVGELDLQRAAAQREELLALEAAQAQTEADRRSALGMIGQSGLEAGVETQAQLQLQQGRREVSDDVVRAIASKYNIDENEARAFYETTVENPALYEFLDAIRGE